MKHKKEESKSFKAAITGKRIGLIMGVFLVCFALATRMIPTPVLLLDDEKHWQIIWEGTLAQAAEADPGLNTSGFLEIFFINHSATPNATFNQNTSATLEAWCEANMPGKTPYASADNFRLEVDHSTSFDIVVRVRFNRTHAWNGTMFLANDTRCEMQVNSSNWADGEDITNATDGYGIPTRNDTSEQYIWMNFVWNAADAGGYQIDKNGVITIARIYISANF